MKIYASLQCMLGALALLLITQFASAQTVLEQSAEHRYQIDFKVNDAALAKMLPAGWEPMVATEGPAKDCNLRMIFIDRMAVMADGGKTAAQHATRMVYLAIPVRETGTKNIGQMIIHGITDNAVDAPGAFGVYQRATTAKMSRNATANNGVLMGAEYWEFASAGGEHMSLQVEYVRGPARKGAAEVKFFNPSDPSKYQLFKTDQAIDIMRNPTTNPPDNVKKFSYKAGGGKIAALFDGSEKVVSWDVFPWYIRTVSQP